MMEFNVHNLVKWFQLEYPGFVKAMKQADHHYSKEELNPYHLESDVWTHTMMVVLAASQNNTLTEYMKDHLLVAALLHDIGKPMARRENHEKKRVNFYSHEPLSAFLAVPIIHHIIKDFSIGLDDQLILEAIAMHTEVFKLTKEQLTERLVNNQNLANLLMALSGSDHHGRFYEMGDRINEQLVVSHKPHGFQKKQVVVMVGLPCSGKSTTVDRYKDDEKWVILSRDNIIHELGAQKGFASYDDSWNNVDQKEVDKLFQKRKKEAIASGKNVIFDMTNMSRKSRKKNLHGFGDDYLKIADVKMTSLQNIEFRNGIRAGKTIPPEVIERMCKSFYPPLYDEFDDIQWDFT